MEPFVFFIVISAAVLHAVWNALVKIDGDRLAVLAMVSVTEGCISLALISFVPIPLPESWPFLLCAVLLHTGYKLFLLQAYRFGDLTHAYPIARGSATLIITVVSVIIVGETLSQQTFIGVMIIAVGITSLAFARGFGVLTDRQAVLYALGTGCFIAAYTVVDGLGARHAGSPHAYMVWVTLLDAPPFLAIVFYLRRRETINRIRQRWRAGALAGVAAYAGFWMVIWALTLAPMAPVAALRETSIIFALILGAAFLKESVNFIRILATTAVFAGAVMLRKYR